MRQAFKNYNISELLPGFSDIQDLNIDVIDTLLIDSDFAHCIWYSVLRDFSDSYRPIYTYDKVFYASTTNSDVFCNFRTSWACVFFSLVDAFISRSLTPPPHFEICDLSDDKNHDDSSNELLPPAPPPLRYILFSTLISSHLMINSHFSLDTCQHDILLSIFNFKFIKSTFLHALRRKHTSDSKPYLRG